MAIISSPTYDPKQTAEDLANLYVQGVRNINKTQTTNANATATALTKLGSALSDFQSSLTKLASSTNSVTANSATVSGSGIATATAGSNAAAGTYSFYVEQLATAGQVSYDVNNSSAVGAGSMNVMLADGNSFQVNLANADSNGDGTLTAKEIAAAINVTAANNSRVTASTLTVNGQAKLVLTSANTGAGNGVASLDTSGLGSSALQSDLGAQTVLTAAKDAIVWVGGKTGTKAQQASNVFTVVDDVKFTITAAQAPTADPITLTVAADSAGTAANVQSFVTAYNTLLGVIDDLSARGDHTIVEPDPSDPTGSPHPATPDGAFYNDASVSGLRARLGSALRAVTGGVSLISFGISATRDGTLALDPARLNKTIAANPGKLDALFGRAGIGVDSGALGAMNKVVSSWTSSAGGIISGRKDQNTSLLKDLGDRDKVITANFNSAYKRYLTQFTALQQLQASMTSTSNMFTAMFSSNSGN